MSFRRRFVNLKFQLGEGEFGAAGTDTVELEGLRCSVDIVRAGIAFSQAQIRVWGMRLDLMKRLTVTQQFYIEQRVNNRVIVEVGEEWEEEGRPKQAIGTCFVGTIWDATVDARQAPDVSFNVSANSSLLETSRPVPPLSFRGPVDINLAMQSIADQLGYSFENGGVFATLQNPYKPGTLKSQILSLCKDVGCHVDVDETQQVIAIWPRGGSRSGEIPRIAPDSGLVGYPSFTQGGVAFTTLYNPSIGFGQNVRLETQVPGANGEWTVMGLAHRLEANVPGGQWFTDVECIFSGGPR